MAIPPFTPPPDYQLPPPGKPKRKTLLIPLGVGFAWGTGSRAAYATPERLQAGAARWRAIAPRGWGALSGATLTASPTPGVWFNPQTLRYGIGGAAVAPSALRGAIGSAASTAARQMASGAAPMLAGEMPVDVWQRAAAEMISQNNAAMAWIGSGNQEGPALAAFAKAMEFHLERLEAFAAALESLTAEAAGNRAENYGTASQTTAEAARRAAAVAGGFTEERRVLGAAEHCGDCVDFAALDWQPVGTLPPIGESACMFNCHCHFEYR